MTTHRQLSADSLIEPVCEAVLAGGLQPAGEDVAGGARGGVAAHRVLRGHGAVRPVPEHGARLGNPKNNGFAMKNYDNIPDYLQCISTCAPAVLGLAE